ncbi:MAG TPA: LysM domain-containing protein [Gaiellaceae bacterium]|nr:LysM domain-containing protein [Gaiellaceae bacterium]
MAPRAWKPFAAPAAFLLVVTIVVLIFHSSLRGGHTSSSPTTTSKQTPAAPTPKTYIVRPGDTLASIAAKTGVGKARLATLNPKVQPTSLFIGEKIKLR